MQIIHNAMQSPDGTILESRNRHDYVTHLDANGKTYVLDGGLDYIRRSVNGDEKMLTVTTDDSHNLIRDKLTWGTYGKGGDQTLTHVKLCDMSSNHIQACLDNVTGIYPQIKKAMKNELGFRKLAKVAL